MIQSTVIRWCNDGRLSSIHFALLATLLQPSTECRNVMFSVVSVCHRSFLSIRQNSFHMLVCSYLITHEPVQTSSLGTRPDLFELFFTSLCNPYTYRQAGGWPSTEKPSCCTYFTSPKRWIHFSFSRNQTSTISIIRARRGREAIWRRGSYSEMDAFRLRGTQAILVSVSVRVAVIWASISRLCGSDSRRDSVKKFQWNCNNNLNISVPTDGHDWRWCTTVQRNLFWAVTKNDAVQWNLFWTITISDVVVEPLLGSHSRRYGTMGSLLGSYILYCQ